MCGIVGYVGGRPCRELLLAGLEKLEYRGYDSAGVSVLDGDRVDSVRAVGNLSYLREAVAARANGAGGGVATATAEVNTGIGHTRWATHGRVTEENAHPHFDTADRIHIVLNGIVENHVELHERLASGDDERFIASAIPAFLKESRTIKVLNDDEIVVVRPEGSELLDLDGNPIEREPEEVDWDEAAAEKGGYETFMLKE